MRTYFALFIITIAFCTKFTVISAANVDNMEQQTPKFEENYWQYDYLRIVDNLLYGVPDSDSLVAECLGFIDNAISANRADIEKSINIYGKDYMVTSIGEKAFKDCQFLQKVTIPDCIRTFGKECFKGCVNLQSVEIPESTEIIDNYAFAGCIRLKSIFIPKNIVQIGNEYTIGQMLPSMTNVFYGCNLNKIVVDKQNRHYDSRGNCNAIINSKTNSLIVAGVNTRIPKTVTSIGDESFVCQIWLEKLKIPQDIEYIEYTAFDGCSMLSNIKVSKANKVYDSRDNCNAVMETATNTLVVGSNNTIIPETTKKIGSMAFSGRAGLREIVIPSGVDFIMSGAFNNCINLERVVLPKTIHYNYPFGNCIRLNMNTIPGNGEVF